MKKIVLIFLALTLVVMSCSADDATGSGGAGAGGAGSGGAGAGANTPAGRSWASKVGGKTFTDSNGDRIKFTSNGIPPNHLGEEETWINDDGVELGIISTVTFSMPKAISANQVIIKAHSKDEWTKGPNKGKVEENTVYIAYELDDSEALILTSSDDYDNLADVKFENMHISAFNPSKLNELKASDWFSGVVAGSIFMSEEFKVKREWGEYVENKGLSYTNEVSTYGYLRIGDLGRMDGRVHDNRKQDNTHEPIDSIESDVLDSAKQQGSITADNENGTSGTDGYSSQKLNIGKSYYFTSGNNRIYVLRFDREDIRDGETRNFTEYNIYNLEYDSDAKDTINFISSSADRLEEMPKGTVLKYADKIN